MELDILKTYCSLDLRRNAFHAINRDSGQMEIEPIAIDQGNMLNLTFQQRDGISLLKVEVVAFSEDWHFSETLFQFNRNDNQSVAFAGFDILDQGEKARLIIGGMGITIIESTDPIGMKFFKFKPGQQIGMGIKQIPAENNIQRTVVCWNRLD